MIALTTSVCLLAHVLQTEPNPCLVARSARPADRSKFVNVMSDNSLTSNPATG